MQNSPVFTRPTFGEAMTFWRSLLQERRLPTECQWLFEENLCFEKAKETGALALKYQTRLTPAPPEAEMVAYRSFCDSEAPVVFYRIGSSRGKSLCVLLCDQWFEPKSAAEGFVGKPEWLMLFHPGHEIEVEEIRDADRWKTRLVKHRPLHDVDFSMTLRAVHETLAHGRTLTSYEHYALRFLHAWKQFDREKNRLDNPNATG